MCLESKILNFPETKNQKIKNAISIFRAETADIALREFVRLVDDGCDEAFAFVGAIYEYGGEKVNQDYEKALFYYEQSVERYGAVEAYLGLARIYYYGLGVKRDCCKALDYCKTLLEETDNMYANYVVGKMYMDGCCVEKNPVKAREYFLRAWELGYVFGLTNLGFLEQSLGHIVKGWYLRVKAGFIAFMIARKNINDRRIREF
jgi:uncharacterized protein